MKGHTKLLSLLVLVGSFHVYAQNQQVVVEQTNEAVLNSAPIDINGYVKDKPRATDSELEYLKQEINKQQNELEINKEKEKGYKELQKTTEKLADATEEYLEEKKESQAAIDAYNAKIKCLMEEGRDPKECDKDKADVVKTAQAAPVIQKEVAPEQESNKIRVIPFAGVTNYSAQGFVNMDSNQNIGVRAESDVTSSLTIGVGVESLEVNNVGINPSVINAVNNSAGFGSTTINNTGLNSVSYKSLGLEVYGKYNLINRERFKVYGGLGLAYNRSTQTFNEGNLFGFPTPMLFNDSNTLDSNFVSGRAFVGTNISFGSNWGANLDVGYARGLRNNTNNNYLIGTRQRLLQEFARSIQKADAVSLQAGVSYSF